MTFHNFSSVSTTKKQAVFFIVFGILILGISTLWTGCAGENPNLVNPPGGLDSVYIRFINFASDGNSRILSLDKTIETSLVLQNASSSIINSPSDSAITTVISGGVDEYKPKNNFHFSRSSFQTLIALPTISSASIQRPVDTLMALYTPYSYSSNLATVRMMNCNADSTKKYSLRLGCPNGIEIAYDNGFRTQSSPQELPGGRIGVTLVERSTDSNKAIDLFECNLEDKGSYTFFVVNYGTGKPSLYLLNERTFDANSLTQLVAIPQRTASIRTVNLSKTAIDIERIDGKTTQSVSKGVSANTVTDYIPITACSSFASDSFSVNYSGSAESAILSTSLEALKSYTLLTFDYSHPIPALIIPEQQKSVTSGTASIRVVNALYSEAPITVSLGAMTDTKQPSGFASGTILSSNLTIGNYSPAVSITEGEIPITVFTANSPSRLLLGTVAQIVSGNKYLLVITSGANDITTASLIQETQTSGNAVGLPKGSFVQIVHAIGTKELITCSFDRVLSGAKLYYSNSISTIIPSGDRILSISGIGSIPTTVSADSSLLAIVTGMDVSDVLLFNARIGTILPTTSRRRFINACKEVPSVVITQDSLNGSVISSGLQYQNSIEIPVSFEQRITLVFSDPVTKKVYSRIENVSFPLGKNYSIIFIGSSENFSAIIEQEF